MVEVTGFWGWEPGCRGGGGGTVLVAVKLVEGAVEEITLRS
jgi:hypothetical protein